MKPQTIRDQQAESLKYRAFGVNLGSEKSGFTIVPVSGEYGVDKLTGSIRRLHPKVNGRHRKGTRRVARAARALLQIKGA